MKLKDQKILLAHSNVGEFYNNWHIKRCNIATELGYKIDVFNMSQYFPNILFQKLDRLWKKRDYKLLKFYEILGNQITNYEIFIHFGGWNIHPDFLEQFNQVKIFHCADDPDSSLTISKPVCSSYDVHAISNPACIKDYVSWGCENVFFWPLGSTFINEEYALKNFTFESYLNRSRKFIFIGSKFGAQNFRFIHKIPFINRCNFLWKKKYFMEKIESEFSNFIFFGSHWSSGRISDDLIPEFYFNSQIGLNVHNSLGPVNSRLYDYASFGILQICDNKNNLSSVFDLNKEIIGYSDLGECIQLLRYYEKNLEEAYTIAFNARNRFLQEYSTIEIWKNFFTNLNSILNLKK